MSKVITIGLDIAKHVVQVHGVDEAGTVAIRRKLRRAELLQFFEGLNSCLVGMEVCATAHYWARSIIMLGHRAKLMPPTCVKPHMKRQKNDAADAEPICKKGLDSKNLRAELDSWTAPKAEAGSCSGTIKTYTIDYSSQAPRGIVIVRLAASGARFVAMNDPDEPSIAQAMIVADPLCAKVNVEQNDQGRAIVRKFEPTR